jgi:hypothetical protein
LKLAINRHLRKWVKKHASMLANDLRGVAREKPDLFNSVIDEMEQEGLLTKEIGSKGALILVYCSATEQPLCQNLNNPIP